ncbi:tRNA (adenosine(37)-N6)-threonylcarbamoyltransferase complex ATPase subunit type 1 TsaE [Aliiroseovarius sp. 2305UL8-7]|uniref:tRNA (adenosine(37)-N6)-threonylcarbamoyltransferase complex ATPase subunit type 1 TsaE n=1 Tax=Aliiroseovarius conchicola TaxID=3121637 RepID=UPI0035285925
MSQAFSHQVVLTSPDQTRDLAVRLSETLRAGDVLLLEGGIGAGKTHFARSLIQARLAQLGLIEDVPSPTFTLVQTYDIGEVEIWHADLYRLSHPDEIVELGILQAFEEAICLIEWPDRLDTLAPSQPLMLSFEYGEDLETRVITFSGDKERWQDRMLGALE